MKLTKLTRIFKQIFQFSDEKPKILAPHLKGDLAPGGKKKL